jgi:hypothetical protein
MDTHFLFFLPFLLFCFFIFYFLAGSTSAHMGWARPSQPSPASGPAGQNNSTHDACGAVKGLIIIQSYHV